jgi:hypothetical protein
MQWSDSIRAEKFDSFVTKIKEIIFETILKETELQMWRQTRLKKLNKLRMFDKRLRSKIKKLELIKKNAMHELNMKL